MPIIPIINLMAQMSGGRIMHLVYVADFSGTTRAGRRA